MKNLYMAGLLLALGTTACQSTGQEEEPPESESDATGETRVVVTGGEGTVTGDSEITVKYEESDDINDRIPDWVINPTIGGVTGAVGVAPKNHLSIREQLDEARLNGRLEIVSMLELRVQRVGRSELEQDVRAEGEERGDRSRKNTLGIDRNILDSVLAGSRQRALWFDNKTEDCYVWMVLDGAVLGRADHDIVRDVSVFTANQAIRTEYQPPRPRREPPKVIVELPDKPAPEPQPEAPLPPLEELEGALKPIETIPVDSDDENGGQSDE